MQAPGQQLVETLIISTYEVLWVRAIILGGNGGTTVDGFNGPNKYTQHGLRFPADGHSFSSCIYNTSTQGAKTVTS